MSLTGFVRIMTFNATPTAATACLRTRRLLLALPGLLLLTEQRCGALANV